MGEDLCYRDPTLGLQDLYNKLQAGPGVRVIEPAAVQLGKLANTVTGLHDRLDNVLRRAGGNWQGATATAATNALQRAGGWASKSGEATHASTARVSDYAASYATLKSQVAPPVPVPTLSFFGSIADNFGAMSDHSRAIKHNTDNAVAAARALAEHERRTNAAIVAFPDIEPPPPVTKPSGRNPISPSGRPAPTPSAAPGRWEHPGTNGLPPGDASSVPAPSSSTHSAAQPQPAPALPGPPNAGPGTTGGPTLTPGPGNPGTPGILPPPIARGPGTGNSTAPRSQLGDRSGTPGRGSSAWSGFPASPMHPRGLGTPASPPGGPGLAPAGPARPPNPPMGIPPFLVGQPQKKDERDRHYNDTYLPSDELFRPPSDDAVSPVIPRERFHQ